MKIKNTFLFIFSIVLLASTALMAESFIVVKTVEPLCLGKSNPYKIPTPGMLPSYPVTASEYCAFLQTYASDESCWFYSEYYDGVFIETSQDWISLATDCIYRSGDSPHYHYCVVGDYFTNEIDKKGKPLTEAGHPLEDRHRPQNYILDGLRSEKARAQFMAQRQKPSLKEVCDYLNDKIQGDDGAAAAIKANYNGSYMLTGYKDESNVYQSTTWESSVDLLFKHADEIAAGIISNASLYEELGRAVPAPWSFGADVMNAVSLSTAQSQIAFQWNGSFYQAICDVTLEYHRPAGWTELEGTSQAINVDGASQSETINTSVFRK
ncbi:MAG: hypothetical protein WCO92_04200 [Verrucomicrobiota bacterium]